MFLTGLVMLVVGTVFAVLGARDLRNPGRAARH
jgi:hypothetical protein